MRSLLVLLVTALLTFGSTAAQQPTSSQQEPAKTTQQPAQEMKALASPDKDFATKAAEGGMAEVALAELATRQASNEEVKQFAQRIVTDHTQINNELKDWASKKSLTLPSDMGAKHKATHDKLAKLSGANFDREFVREMVKAHDKDVTMFEKQSRDSRDPELKAWAGQKLPTLREHQTLARELAGKVGAGTSTYKKATKS